MEAWRAALADKPALVSLGVAADLGRDGEDLPAVLRDRLKLLGRKVFSNRQWRTYWERQHALASRLADLLDAEDARAAGTQVGASPGLMGRGASLRAWATLAQEKMANQDTYLHAIETESDAVEERLEGSLDPVEEEEGAKAAPPTQSERPSAYDLYEERMKDLRGRLAFHARRKAVAEMARKLVQLQLASQTSLRAALDMDLSLVRRESAIASAQAESEDPAWAALWRPIATAASQKTERIAEELVLGDQRKGALEVEADLLAAQLVYRENQSAEIRATLAVEDSAGAMLRASLTTAWDFLRGRALRIVFILLGIWIGVRLAMRAVSMAARGIVRAVEDDDPDATSAAEQRAQTIATVFRGLARIIVLSVAVLIAMEAVGISTGPILGSVAILGLAISFGSQNLVRDVVNGFFILVEDQYGVGDSVRIGDHSGVVEKINIRSTRLRSLDGNLHMIPNGGITTVENMTRDWSRVVCVVGVGYGADIDHVEEVTNRVGKEIAEHPDFKNKFLEVPTFNGITELGDSAVTVRCMAKVKAGEQWGLQLELNRRLKKAFDTEGIEIPFPQRVVWHKKETGD